MADEHGEVIRTYRGKALAKFSDTVQLPCQVHIEQVENGEILIRCIFSPKYARIIPYSNDLEIEHLNGQADRGLTFETRGKLFRGQVSIKSTGYVSIALISQEVVLGIEAEADSDSLYRFSLVNFEFLGNEGGERNLNKGKQTTKEYYRVLKITLPWGEIAIHPLHNESEIIRRVKAQKGIAVTCEALVNVLSGANLADTIEKVDELCRLLSLARGTKINWISAESMTKDGKIKYVILKQSVTWPFSSLTLIDYRNPNDTPLFVEKAYPVYLRRRDSYNLDIAVEQYLDAKRETAYLETRGLAAVALIDSLQQLYASESGVAEIVKGFGKQNNKVREHLKIFMKSAFPDIKDEELQEMLQKVPELNRKSFLNLLKMWTHTLGLQIPDSELAAVRDTRNSLAHKMCFKSTDQVEKVREYFRLINIINQAFLKLLDYRGYFIHIDLNTLAFERKELV